MSELQELLAATGFVAPWLVTAMVLMWGAMGARAYVLRAPSRLDPVGLLASSTGGTVVDHAVRALKAEAARRGPSLERAHLESILAPVRDALGAGATVVQSATAVAPLMGLLGTVTGMIETFDSLAEMALFTRGGGIGAGIGEAMMSTQLGLVVAVPGLLIGATLDRRQTTLEDALDAVAERLASQATMQEAA